MTSATRIAPEDAFARGIALTRSGAYADARVALEAAAAVGHADARAWLGLYALHGYGRPQAVGEAVAALEAAEAAGSPEASYQLALMAFADRTVPRDPVRIAERLATAAERDHVAALRALGLVYAAAADPAQQPFAERCFARAAALGDARSYYMLALRIAASAPDVASRERALGYLASAATVLPRAARHLAPGTPPLRCDAGPTGRLPRPDLAARPRFTAQVHHREPLVETVDDFLSRLECEYLIALGEPHLHRSVTVADDGRLLPHPDRVSSDVALFGGRDDFAARWLQARMLDWLDVPIARGEHMILLRYGPGEHYKPHVDYLPPGARGNVAAPDQPGQRVHTVFAYLDGVDAGGQTVFPQLGKQITPARGRIVHFTNMTADGVPDPLSLHAGLPVEKGTKWLATIWTRERDYRRY